MDRERSVAPQAARHDDLRGLLVRAAFASQSRRRLRQPELRRVRGQRPRAARMEARQMVTMNDNERQAAGFASREQSYREIAQEHERHERRISEIMTAHEERLRGLGLTKDADEVRQHIRERAR
jgi:hypothetical protein